jgi:hypothetical protein
MRLRAILFNILKFQFSVPVKTLQKLTWNKGDEVELCRNSVFASLTNRNTYNTTVSFETATDNGVEWFQ